MSDEPATSTSSISQARSVRGVERFLAGLLAGLVLYIAGWYDGVHRFDRIEAREIVVTYSDGTAAYRIGPFDEPPESLWIEHMDD